MTISKSNVWKRPKCYCWSEADDVAGDYLKLVPQLGLDAKFWPWVEDYAYCHAGRLLWDVDFLTRNYKFSRCVNIGGAPFIFEYLIKKAHPEIDVVSVDLQPSRFPGAERALGITIVELDVERACSAAQEMLGQYECVVFCEIFEHLRIDLLKTMRLVRTLLNEDGFMYLTMPNGLGIGALYASILRGRTGPDPISEWSKLAHLGHMGHVREYSSIELLNVLSHCGFEVQQCLYRRKIGYSGRIAYKLRDRVLQMLTLFLPKLGNEIVVVAGSTRMN